MKNSVQQYASGFLIILQCLLFGLAFIAVKSLLNNAFPPFALLFIRFIFGAIFLFLIGGLFKFSNAVRSKVGSIGKLSRNELIQGSVSGIVLFGAFALQTVGANFTTPAKNGVFTDLFVIVVPIINMVLTKKFSLKPFLAAILAFWGVTLVLNLYSGEPDLNIGDVITIFAGILFAIQFVVMEHVAKKTTEKEANPYNFTIVQLLVVAICSLIVSLISETEKYKNIEWTGSVGWLIYLSLVATSIAYLIQFFAQKKISAENTAVLSCSESIFTLTFSLVFGFDNFKLTLLIGVIIMVAGMILSSWSPKKD